MKKMLVTLTAVGALAMSGGVALAQQDAPEPTDPVPTCEEQARERVRDQNQVVVQTQERQQLRIHEGTCDGDCTGDQVQQREQSRVEDGAGAGTQQRARTAGQGNG